MQIDTEHLKSLLERVTPGEWSHCEVTTAIISKHHPIANVESGEWGDEYPCIKLEGGTLDRSAVPYMERTVYGHIDPNEAEANKHLIALAPTLARRVIAAEKLAEALRECVKRLDLMLEYTSPIIKESKEAIQEWDKSQ